MLIEIALGIVVAVLILKALPHILWLATGAGAIALVVIILFLVTTFVLEEPIILLAIPFTFVLLAILHYYNKSSKVRIFSWGAFSLFWLLYTTGVLYSFHDALYFRLAEAPIGTFFCIIFFSAPTILSLMKFKKVIKKESEGAISSSSSHEGISK